MNKHITDGHGLNYTLFTAICLDLTLTNGTIGYNSSDTTPRLEGTVATHSCDIGYGLSNGTERICQSDRTWSGGNITCEGIVRPSCIAIFCRTYS